MERSRIHRPSLVSTVRGLGGRLPDPVKAQHADLMHRLRWRNSPVARVTRAFVKTHGLTVQDGPFAGMVFPRFAVGRGEMLVPQLLGAYEFELHDALRRAMNGSFDQIVDIGTSDGYYAVGLARGCPGATVVGYEMNDFPARICRSLAEANGVEDRLQLLGECRLEDLQRLPHARSFVLCDCEGAEDHLMQPQSVPLLQRASAIVELHEHVSPGITQRITGRFERTHEIAIVASGRRYPGQWPLLQEVPGVGYMDHELGLSEFRPYPMSWAVMEPRES